MGKNQFSLGIGLRGSMTGIDKRENSVLLHHGKIISPEAVGPTRITISTEDIL